MTERTEVGYAIALWTKDASGRYRGAGLTLDEIANELLKREKKLTRKSRE
jgi:hypothetical protein